MTTSPLIAATTKQPSLLPSLNWHDNDRLMMGVVKEQNVEY